jgi:nucleoside-diphosphate-sugar epimerase
MTTNNIFKLLVDATIKNEPFNVFNPEHKQYFTYAADIARAVQKTGRSILNSKQIFNIIPENSTSVRRLAEIFKNVGGLRFSLDPILGSDNDSAVYAPSISSKKALDMIGWSAETSIEDGVRICLGGPR